MGAQRIHWDLGGNGLFSPYAGDVERVLTDWQTRAESPEQLLAAMVEALNTIRPTVIITLDPRHGNSCHPAHRAAGALLLHAVEPIERLLPSVYLLAERVVTDEFGIGFAPFRANDPAVEFFDTTSVEIGHAPWSYFIEVLDAHPTQYRISTHQRDLITNAPARRRRVFAVPRPLPS